MNDVAVFDDSNALSAEEEDLFASASEGSGEGDETYLFSPRVGSVKVRDGTIDIKLQGGAPRRGEDAQEGSMWITRHHAGRW